MSKSDACRTENKWLEFSMKNKVHSTYTSKLIHGISEGTEQKQKLVRGNWCDNRNIQTKQKSN